MKYEIRLRKAAENDLAAARDWYRAQSPAAVERFAIEVGAAIVAIVENPAMFARVHGEIRRATTRRFPYAIYFVVEAQRISSGTRAYGMPRDDPTGPPSSCRGLP
jgi:plasmid stabilization system protein ParE